MKEPYGKGVANHPDPESYAVSREAGGWSVDKGTHRLGIELCNRYRRRCRRRQDRRKATFSTSLCEMGWNLPESETPCMCGTTLRWNWEISSPPTAGGAVGRIGKPIGV